MTKDELINLAVQSAKAYQLDPILVCSVVEQESAWNPWAVRFEPAFFDRYLRGITTISDTERTARGFSYGLMQCMGQVARENGFKGQYLTMICDPYVGLDIGCRVLKHKLALHPGSTEMGLLAWNGGGAPKYGQEVLARMTNYSAVGVA